MLRSYRPIIIPALILLAAAITGCKKFVEVAPPNNSITTAETFATDAQAAAAMAGIYSQMIQSRKYPEGLFTGSPSTIEQLRARIQ